MERPGGAKEDVAPPPLPHAVEQIPGEHRGTAAAARPAAVDVLALGVKNHGAAVGVVAQLDPVPAQQLQQQLAAQQPQIPGYNQVIVAGGPAGVLQMGGNGVVCGGGRSQGCTMWKMFSVKFNAYSSPEARRF